MMFRKISMIILLVAALCAPALGEAWKDEVVYITCASDGAREGVYVINAIYSDAALETADSGNYDSVSALTYGMEAVVEGGGVSLKLPEGRSFYQGNIDVPSPWIIDVKYFLNGEEKTAEAIAGASGDIGIEISASKNPDAQGEWFDKFALQGVMTLPADACFDIVSEGATVTCTGSSYTVSHISLPGKDSVWRVDMRADNFHMDGVQLLGVRLSMDIDVSAYAGEQLSMLGFAVSSLNTSAAALNDAAAADADSLSAAVLSAQGVRDSVVSAYGEGSDEAAAAEALVSDLESAAAHSAETSAAAASLSGMTGLISTQLSGFDISGIMDAATGGEWSAASFIAQGGISVKSVQFIMIFRGIGN